MEPCGAWRRGHAARSAQDLVSSAGYLGVYALIVAENPFQPSPQRWNAVLISAGRALSSDCQRIADIIGFAALIVSTGFVVLIFAGIVVLRRT